MYQVRPRGNTAEEEECLVGNGLYPWWEAGEEDGWCGVGVEGVEEEEDYWDMLLVSVDEELERNWRVGKRGCTGKCLGGS